MSVMSVADQQNIPPEGKKGNQSIFIWVDILGFSEAVDTESRYEELAELLKKFQNLFNEDDSYRTKIISDGIILQITNPEPKSLVKILQGIGEKQFRFINKHKHFIRGGISVGTKFEKGNSDSSLFISNGLARAVKIEGNSVDWPVIGTDSKVLSKMRKLFQINKDNECFNLARAYNARGEELYFIDFLKDNEDGYYSLLNKKIKEFQNNPKVLNKYIWLLRYYHNRLGSDNLSENLVEVVL